MNTSKKESFLLYLEHGEFIEQLTDAQAGELFKGLFKYTSTGQVPEFSGILKMAFIAIRQDLDRNQEKYEQKCERMRQNGLKGGRPKKETEETEEVKETEENMTSLQKKNQKVFSKTKKSHYDNDNEYENDNVNDNVLSLNEENSNFGEKYTKNSQISDEDREILKKYVKRKKLATKNVSAYVSKIIQNGDHTAILEKERNRSSPKKREKIIQEQLASIHDKKSAGRILYSYYANGEFPPAEFDEIAQKYDIDTYDKLYNAFQIRAG